LGNAKGIDKGKDRAMHTTLKREKASLGRLRVPP